MMKIEAAAGKSSPLPEKKGSPAAGDAMSNWEVRPGGMLVQKRILGGVSGGSPPPAPNIRVRVKHGDAYLEIYLSSQSTFGELKKLVSERTGMHPLDQKVVYKNRDRDSTAFLDTSGVKDGSKVTVTEDPSAHARRCLEMRRNAKMEKASRSISEISLEVDKLASKVSEMKSMAAAGEGGVDAKESDLTSLTEKLMDQLVKLDGIVADGDAKTQKRIQVRRVQKYIEALDVLKVKTKRVAAPPPHEEMAAVKRIDGTKRGLKIWAAAPPAVVVTTKWEVFDSLFSPTASSAAAATKAATTTKTSGSAAAPAAKLDWELF